jgi:hypothetical protein
VRQWDREDIPSEMPIQTSAKVAEHVAVTSSRKRTSNSAKRVWQTGLRVFGDFLSFGKIERSESATQAEMAMVRRVILPGPA